MTRTSEYCGVEVDAPVVDAGGGAAVVDPPAAAFYEAFTDASLKTDPNIQAFKSTEDMAKGYSNLLKRFGTDPKLRVELPADPADKAGMRAVYAKLGLPEKPDGYGFKLDEKATDADKAFVGRATAALHEIGLPKGQAEGVFKFWMDEAASVNAAQTTAFEAARAEGEAAVKKEWGAAYDQRAREVGALLTKYGAPELVKQLDNGGIGNHPQFALFLGKVLDAMAEPGSGDALSGDAAASNRALTPAQSTAEARKLEADPAFRDGSHPQHKAVVEARNRLLQMADAKAA